MDFVADSLADGRRLRVFNVVDDCTREALVIEVDTSFIRKRRDQFRCTFVESGTPALASYRWTVDRAEDLQLVRIIYAHFGEAFFSMADAVELMRQRPELAQLNAHIARGEGYRLSLRKDLSVDVPE